jgi:hypothetical protein
MHTVPHHTDAIQMWHSFSPPCTAIPPCLQYDRNPYQLALSTDVLNVLLGNGPVNDLASTGR